MRLISGLFTVFSAGLAGFAAGDAALRLTRTAAYVPAAVAPPPTARATGDAGPETGFDIAAGSGAGAAPGPETDPRKASPWPALFGEVTQMPEAPPEAVPPPPPPTPPPPPPPKLAQDHVLQGLVMNGSARWAIVRSPQGDIMLREGDVFEQTGKVARITSDGVEITSPAGTEHITFAD